MNARPFDTEELVGELMRDTTMGDAAPAARLRQWVRAEVERSEH